MPELPEVQTVVNDLAVSGIIGCKITGVEVGWPATIATPCSDDFSTQIAGMSIREIHRRGKYIVIQLDDGWVLVVHMRMTGRFFLSTRSLSPMPHVHVVLSMSDGRHLCYHDTRKFGRFFLTQQPGRLLGALGPEPLLRSFTSKSLKEALLDRRRQIKPLLLDQTFIAGLGNIYVDEALWTAKIHPLRRSNTLTEPEIRRLHRAIRQVLRRGLENRGTTLGNGEGNFYSLGAVRGNNESALKVFRRTGLSCRRCGHEVERIIVGQRSTHLCSKCQRG